MDDQGVGGQEWLSAPDLQRRAIAGSMWTAVHTVVTLPVAFVANAIVARSLGVSSYGHLAFLSAALGLAVAFGNFGFSTSLIQTGSAAESRGLRSATDDLLRKSLGFHLAAELPILVVTVFALAHGDPWWQLIALVIGVGLPCLIGGASLSLTIENRTAVAAKVSIGVTLVLQAATVATAVSTGSASAVWAIRTVIPAAALGLNLLLLDAGRRRAVLRPKLPRSLGGAFWRFALFSWVSSILALLVFSRSEIFLLRAFHKNEALGLFALAFGLSQQITSPADAMLHALLPAIAGVLSAWPERAKQAFERSTRVSALICGGVAAAVVPPLIFAIPVVYGKSFKSAAWLFVPLALVSIFQSINNPVVAFANGRRRGGLIVRAYAASLVVDVVVAVALIPVFGAWGAVSANVGGQLVGIGWLAASEPLALQAGLRPFLGLYRSFALGLIVGCAAVTTGLILERFSPAAAAGGSFLLGAIVFVLVMRHMRVGLTYQDHAAIVGASSRRVRPYLSRMLMPLTSRQTAE